MTDFKLCSLKLKLKFYYKFGYKKVKLFYFLKFLRIRKQTPIAPKYMETYPIVLNIPGLLAAKNVALLGVNIYS